MIGGRFWCRKARPYECNYENLGMGGKETRRETDRETERRTSVKERREERRDKYRLRE